MTPAPTPAPLHSLTAAPASATAGEVLALIRSGRAATRGALGRATGLSRTAVNARLTALAEAGLVLEGEEESATGGRPATTLVLNRDAGLVLAVAVGRSRSQLSVCSLDGTELAGVSLEEETGPGPDVLMPLVVDHLERMLQDLGRTGAEVRGVGMSLAGTVDPGRAMSVDSPALTGWDGVPLTPWLRRVTDAPVMLDNDMRVMALSQMPLAGAEEEATVQEHDDALVLKASTGIGLGIVADGRLVRGHRNAAGELGHVKVPAAAGLRCRCGETGCLETVASGWALVERLRAEGEDVDHVRDLVAAAGRGSGRARAVVREAGRHIGEALAAAVTVLNPRTVVVGGDMAGAFDTFSAGLREGLFSATTALAGRDLQVLPAAYGDRAGVVGCVRLALESVLSPRAVDAALARPAG
ncbi:sugar kinase [Nocardioides flavus (ex Wang et al. 2016)]|uniref:Sugar kinase n=1 Tax=Nocardioides flavus (ex Wang et al. 2016) TaxID=2058780 RepID=A0ABQ3HN12_9ACTN|nr:ROK family transcriptional regulator [Nocardioides flavus (ex Wang et al. 2016)]GHE18325.1 sugar kinase [Nocardioides flavus (ex Wang et al. 2016)]